MPASKRACACISALPSAVARAVSAASVARAVFCADRASRTSLKALATAFWYWASAWSRRASLACTPAPMRPAFQIGCVSPAANWKIPAGPVNSCEKAVL